MNDEQIIYPNYTPEAVMWGQNMNLLIYNVQYTSLMH
jgi:hypothetical protein